MDQTQNYGENNIYLNINPLLNQGNTMINYNINNPMNQNAIYNMNMYQNQNNINPMNNNLNINMMYQNLNMMMQMQMNQMQMQMMNQMMQMNQMNQLLLNKIEFKDIYPYINEKKINITFISEDNKKFENIKIPFSLKKNEIYATANKFKSINNSNLYSDIKLFHNNKLLENDDSTIECILDGDLIKIIPDVDYNNSEYKSLLEKHKNSPKINFIFCGNSGFNLVRVFPNNITIKKMFEIFFKSIKIKENKIKEFVFIYSGEYINIYDNELLKNKFHNSNANIEFYLKNNVAIYPCGPGKVLSITIENDKNLILNIEEGTLEQIKNFFKKLKGRLNGYGYQLLDNPIIFPEEIELKDNDIRTFSSIGIRNNFTCKVKILKK